MKQNITHELVSSDELQGVEMAYGIHESPFGKCLIAITKRGICHVSFFDGKESEALGALKSSWPKAIISRDDARTKPFAEKIFHPTKSSSLHLLFQGTVFQLKVWKALLRIPSGKTVSYSELARSTGYPKAARAVGSACGKNSIGFLIPCHRVLASSGKSGGYRWGVKRKEAMLVWESAAL